jgi:hypothetical protein
MSILPWLNKKEKTQVETPVEDDSPISETPSEKRKSKRLERREQLYKIVRESMTRAGVLSADYKFKVLSMDTGGGQYLVMVDCNYAAVCEPERLNGIEEAISKAAMSAHEIEVTAVYWRFNAVAMEQSASH